MTDPNFDAVTRHAPGALGSLAAAILLRGSFIKGVALFLGGIAASAYGAPWLAATTGSSHELAGFLTGLFAMTIVAKLLEVVEAIKPADLAERILKKLGL